MVLYIRLAQGRKNHNVWRVDRGVNEKGENSLQRVSTGSSSRRRLMLICSGGRAIVQCAVER